MSEFWVAHQYSGPFGLEMGMKINEIDKNANKIAEGRYKVSVTKPHTAFDLYVVFVSPTKGLYMIRAIKKNIPTNVFGNSLKSKYNSIEEKLNNAYGKSKRYDFIQSGSLWSENQYWMMGLLKGDRSLATVWSEKTVSKFSNNITGVLLKAKALNQNTGALILEYEFSNFEDSKKEITSIEDSSL